MQNWNDGKSQEYQDRKTYQVSGAAQPHGSRSGERSERDRARFGESRPLYALCHGHLPQLPGGEAAAAKAGVPYEEKDAAQYAEEAKALGLRQAPTLVAWGEEPTLYVGAAQIKAFLQEYAQCSSLL